MSHAIVPSCKCDVIQMLCHVYRGGSQTTIIMVKPGGSGAASVDVDVDPIALLGGRHEHVLTRVVAWMLTLKCNHKVKVRLNLTKKLFSIREGIQK